MYVLYKRRDKWEAGGNRGGTRRKEKGREVEV